MEFRKMVTITLCTRLQKRHWCIDQSYQHFIMCGTFQQIQTNKWIANTILWKTIIFLYLIKTTEKAMAPHSTLAWKIPWTEKPGGLQSMGRWGSDTTERLHFHFLLPCTGEGNGNPLQCFCLQNLRDGGAWWAAVYGVAQSRTWLKRLHFQSPKGWVWGWSF